MLVEKILARHHKSISVRNITLIEAKRASVTQDSIREFFLKIEGLLQLNISPKLFINMDKT